MVLHNILEENWTPFVIWKKTDFTFSSFSTRKNVEKRLVLPRGEIFLWGRWPRSVLPNYSKFGLALFFDRLSFFMCFYSAENPLSPGTTMVFQRVENARPRLPAQHACHSRFRKSSLFRGRGGFLQSKNTWVHDDLCWFIEFSLLWIWPPSPAFNRRLHYGRLKGSIFQPIFVMITFS